MLRKATTALSVLTRCHSRCPVALAAAAPVAVLRAGRVMSTDEVAAAQAATPAAGGDTKLNSGEPSQLATVR